MRLCPSCATEKNRKNLFVVLQVTGIFLWLSNLKYTDAYFSVYVLCAIAGLFCLAANRKGPSALPRNVKISALLLGILFSALVLSANYPVFQRVRNPQEVSAGSNHLMNCLEAAAVFLGGIPIGYHCLKRFYLYSTGKREYTWGCVSGKRPVRFFITVFFVVLLIDAVYLFTSVYPGCVSHDSLGQITEIASGEYSNFLPYWYTRFIGVVLRAGYAMFGEINRAVAFYSCIQILIMASIFAFTAMTLYQERIPRGAMAAVILYYTVMPYNISFACSMWKDVLFTGFILVMIVSMYRIVKKMSWRVVNYAAMILGGAGVCLMRTNGWYIVLLSFVILLMAGKDIRRKLVLAMAVVTLFGFFMNGPVLRALGIGEIDKVEAMSLPIQQIGRVLSRQREISDDDRAMLEKIVDVDEMPEIYKDWTSDPIKDNLRSHDVNELLDHKGEYLSLWLRLGLQYPRDYFEAWVEVTKGYWNGGYDYYIYAEYVADNPYGIVMNTGSNPVKSLMKAYFAFTRESILFEPLLSIGLNVWAATALLWLCLVKKRKEAVLFVPLFVILAGLWVGSPVFSEFRYAYPVAVSIPFLIPTVLSQEE